LAPRFAGARKPRHQARSLAGFLARRRRLRLAPAQKEKVSSAAAILSLTLAIGARTSAFRVTQPQSSGTILVRTAGPNPLALASVLRQEVPRARPEFRVSNTRTQQELVDRQTIRERLLAMLAVFFAVVALLFAGVGLYGVLDYSVLQRRHEFGIRIAIGAQAGDIARRVTAEVFWKLREQSPASASASSHRDMWNRCSTESRPRKQGCWPSPP